jgi:AP-4 complex subunit epsilon-1
MVVDCLEDADDTLKIKTFDLLYKMTNKHNVEAVTEKMLAYLKEAPHESSVRKDLVIKITNLCENYSPNKGYYVKQMNRLLEMGGDLVTSDLTNKFIQTIAE